MEPRDSLNSSAGTEMFKRLAEDLRSANSPKTVLKRLKTLNTALNARLPRGEMLGGVAFIEAGGLPTLIAHLKGTLTSDGEADAGQMSATPQAAQQKL
jgi:hypothetical protein